MDSNTINTVLSEYTKDNPSFLKYLFDTKKNYDDLVTRQLFRKIPDTSTSSFINIFFSGDNSEYLQHFINYAFQTINFNVMTTINRRIKEQIPNEVPVPSILVNFRPLGHDEETQIVFKGGTNFNFIYNHLKNVVATSNTVTPADKAELLDMLGPVRYNIDSKFTVSDTDMTLHIKAHSQRRFIILQNASYQVIINSLENISETLDHIFKYNDRRNDVKLPPLPTTYRRVLHVFPGLNIFGLIHRIEILKAEPLQRCVDFILRYKTNGDIFNNCQVASYLIEFIDFIVNRNDINQRMNLPTIAISPLLKQYRKDLVIYALHDLKRIRSRLVGLYTNENKNEFIRNLTAGLIDLKQAANGRIENNTELIKDSLEFPEKYKFFKTPSVNDIIFGLGTHNIRKLPPVNIGIVPNTISQSRRTLTARSTRTQRTLRADDSTRSDNYLYCINNSTTPIKMIISNNNRLHYVSVNNSIYNTVAKGRVNNFNLARIKLNVKLANCITDQVKTPFTFTNYANDLSDIDRVNTLNDDIINQWRDVHDGTSPVLNKDIPSEILDISLSDYYSPKNHPYADIIGFARQMAVRINNKYEIICLGYLDIYLDLKDVLYKQIYFSPWIDVKYEKRIVRMFIFLVLAFRLELRMPYENILEKILRIRELCVVIKGAAPDQFAVNLNTNGAYNTLLEYFCNNPQNINSQYIMSKLFYATKISSLIDIKTEFILIEDLIDGLILNASMFHNPDYENIITHFSNLYNISNPSDINLFKNHFKTYVDKLINIITQVETIFNIFIPALEGYRYRQVI